LKKINNSSQQAGACHANPGEVHLILKNSGVIGTVRTSPNVSVHCQAGVGRQGLSLGLALKSDK
jgi:protein tyrosine phosphatase